MSSRFSFSRLGKLIVKQFFENTRFYIFTILAMIGLLALVFAFWLAVGGPVFYEQGIYMIFLFGLFIAGCVFASMSFNMLGNKDKGIYWLSIPATHLEKLICTVFYSTVVFTIAYCLCFYLVKSIGITYLTEYIKNHPGTTYREIQDFDHGFGSTIKHFMYAYFGVQSLYLLGSVYFSRYSFIVTTVVGAAVIFAFAYYIKQINDSMPGDWDLFSFRKFGTGPKDSYLLYSISPTVVDIIKSTMKFAWAPVLWIVTWYRLKEKEL